MSISISLRICLFIYVFNTMYFFLSHPSLLEWNLPYYGLWTHLALKINNTYSPHMFFAGKKVWCDDGGVNMCFYVID